MTQDKYRTGRGELSHTGIGKSRSVTVISMLICLLGIAGILALYREQYRVNAFRQLSGFCETLIEDDPEQEGIVLSSLKRYLSSDQAGQDSQFLEQYGYKGNEFDGAYPERLMLLSAAVMLMTACGFLYVSHWRDRHDLARIAELTDYLEQVNTDGGGTILQRKEDEFAHLQDEMYKTVTTLYQTREAAVAAKENYADHLANIAHQLKTPITAALLSIQMLEKKAEDNYVNRIKRQLMRLNRLEEALLTLSRIDAGTLKLVWEQVDTYTVLCLAADNLADLCCQKEISVQIPDQGAVTFQGDLEWTMEAVMNLMKNCMEHSPDKSVIRCDYSVNPLYVEILICDEGKGFAAEDIPHLFERFYRGEGSAGIGIGLSLARSIIELQNGTITARNLPQGGACFEIRIYSH